jgi:hypothetical protein
MDTASKINDLQHRPPGEQCARRHTDPAAAAPMSMPAREGCMPVEKFHEVSAFTDGKRICSGNESNLSRQPKPLTPS